MKIILFGATGMVGQGVLRQCLLDPGVESILSIGRKPSSGSHPKLRDLIRADMFDFDVSAGELYVCPHLGPHQGSPRREALPAITRFRSDSKLTNWQTLRTPAATFQFDAEPTWGAWRHAIAGARVRYSGTLYRQ
jgi:hypothetical protein